MNSIDLTEPEDSIVPGRIEHRIDEGLDAATGEVHFRYNYLVYSFDHPAGAIVARSYLDDLGSVALFWPAGVTERDPIAKKVIDFLSRRYASLSALGAEGYVEITTAKKQKL